MDCKPTGGATAATLGGRTLDGNNNEVVGTAGCHHSRNFWFEAIGMDRLGQALLVQDGGMDVFSPT